LPLDFLENTVKVREGVKAAVVSDFTNAQVGVKQKVFRPLHPGARHKFGKTQTRALVKHFAKVKHTHIRGAGNLPQRKVFLALLTDENFRVGDDE
jgi:hypothetical protein